MGLKELYERGARLERAETGYRLTPGKVGTEYQDLRERYLLPHARTLTNLRAAL